MLKACEPPVTLFEYVNLLLTYQILNSIKMYKYWESYCAILILFSISMSHALECYVCTDQGGNRDKCLNTIMTCEQEEDSCMTEINWGSTPYWNTGAKKQFYISKQCASRKECEKIRKSNTPDCTHIWYQDWKCSECCQGDRCNYFIISGAEATTFQYKVLIFGTLFISHFIT